MSLMPWDEGYKAPEIDVAAYKSEFTKRAGLASGEAKREMIKTGNPSKLSKQIAKLTEDEMSNEQKLFCQDFAVEFLRDFHAANAFIRAGGPVKSAKVRGPQLKRTPYVEGLIRKVVDSLEEENLVTRKDIIMGLWREANDTESEGASGGARVRALMGLARIKQMDIKIVKNEGVIQHNVMAVPMAVDNDAWAAAAEESQKSLKHDVRK